MASVVQVIRHPSKNDDIDDIIRGDASTITAEGEREAEVLIERTKHMCIDAVISSDCPRTALLAARIGEAISRPIETNALFREWRIPSFMLNRSRKELEVRVAKATIMEIFDQDRQLYDEESKGMLESRYREGFAWLEHYPHQHVLLVGHGKWIVGASEMIVRDSLSGYYRGPDTKQEIDTTSVSTFVRRPNRRTGLLEWVVKTLNDVSHKETQFFRDAERILAGIPS